MGKKMSKKPAKSKYEGKFVATSTFNSKTVVASGRDPMAVRQRAVAKGYNTPVVMYIAEKGSFNLF